MDTYNFTRLPFEYENEYFYTYIFLLYQKMFLKKLNMEFKQFDKLGKVRKEFIIFTKEIWEKEITLNDSGSLYFKQLKNVLELEELYEQITNKYEVIYKEVNIEKNNFYFKVLIVLLIFSMILNIVNIGMILFLCYK